MIVVAYDASREARKAVQLAKTHAKAFGEAVFLMYSMVGGPEIPRADFERAEKDLQNQALGLKEDGIECETLLSVRGLDPGEDVVRIAEEKEASEIILGIQKRSKVGKLLFGSNAQYIILHAPCPVVTLF
jgi:nucleotide-binding universal stress UspA family protein